MLRRVETGERYIGEIPLEQFQDDYQSGRYLETSVEVALMGIRDLTVDLDEPIHICTGYILSEIRRVLTNQGYNIVPSKITGITQEFAENAYKESLVRLGVGDMTTVSKMRSFKGFMSWVKEDLERRERYVKTGWKSWPKWRNS